MDSINAEQEEENRADLNEADAIDKIRELVEQAGTCFLTTGPSGIDSPGCRPMNVLQIDERGHLWFLSASDSHKNQEIAIDPRVTLHFQGSKYSDFLLLHGHAVISKNPGKIRELWKPTLKTWFTGGIEDPRITVIEVRPEGGYYWDTKHGNAVAGLKVMAGALLGKTLDDSIEGRLSP